jgi:hypothetical protein
MTLEKYQSWPTIEDIEKAAMSDLSHWFVLLPNAETPEQHAIVDRIRLRIKELYSEVAK